MGFAKFMSATSGRWLRIVAGAVLVAAGLVWLGGVWGVILAVVGLVPLVAGILDVCLLGTLFFGTPLHGKDVRAGLG